MCEEFCLIHGYDRMQKRSASDKFAYCEACEAEAEAEQEENRPSDYAMNSYELWCEAGKP